MKVVIENRNHCSLHIGLIVQKLNYTRIQCVHAGQASQKSNLLDASQQTLAVNTQVLNHTIRNIMLSGEAPLANRTMSVRPLSRVDLVVGHLTL